MDFKIYIMVFVVDNTVLTMYPRIKHESASASTRMDTHE